MNPSQSPNRYLAEPRLFELETSMIDVKPLPEGGWALAPLETIFRGESGGQPSDEGTVTIDESEYRIRGAYRLEGRQYLEVPALQPAPAVCSKMTLTIDGARRDRLSRCHTLQHLISAAVARLGPSAVPSGTGIRQDAAGGWITFKLGGEPPGPLRNEVDKLVQSQVAWEAPIVTARAKSVEDARLMYHGLFRLDPGLALSGRIRLIVISGIDACPCSGTHWNTSDIGQYKLIIADDLLSEVTRLEFDLQ